MNSVTCERVAPSIRTVRKMLAAGGDSDQDLVGRQRKRFAAEAGRWNCVVRTLAEPVGARDGLLAGVALAHKDVFATAGHVPGVGVSAGAASNAQASAGVLEKLASAGAAHLATLTLSEYCCGATGDNRHFGRPVNPIDPDAVVGGSSSGSAVAVAAGLCPASLGTDTAGSVRIPAATCGIVGLKPTHGLIDTAGVFSLAPSLDTVGILAASASDAAHLLSALSTQGCSRPAEQVSDEIEAALDAPRRWRFANAVDRRGLAPEVAAALHGFMNVVRDMGVVTARQVDGRERLDAAAAIVLHAESAATQAQLLRRGGELPGAAKAVMLPGIAVPAPWYARAIVDRGYERNRFLRTALHDVDLLLTPALSRPVPDWNRVSPGQPGYDEAELQALYANLRFVNYLGLPAIVFPIGADTQGRPVSVQAIARPGQETLLLAFAHQAMYRIGNPGLRPVH
ncbi:amidase [Azohydromonas australica]|uniref:amidase n=1 Tax=Azohydromonas australica TaxID=364039 RepID=UPI0004027779|nr:amidase [Azohydromonas australica]